MNFSYAVNSGGGRLALPRTKNEQRRLLKKRAVNREEIRRAVAQAIVTLRKRVGVSQEALALYSDVDRSYMSQIERGLRSPTIEILVKLLSTLGISFTQLAAEFDKCLAAVKTK